MRQKLFLMTLLLLTSLLGARAQQALPYEYGFEDNDLTADGWVLQGATSGNTRISNNAARSGEYGFQFYYSEQSAYLLSPTLTGGDNGVDVSFWYKDYTNQYGDEQFQVGYTTDEKVTDASEFTFGGVKTASMSWQKYEYTFPAGTKRIAIKYIYNDAYALCLDDFSFTVAAAYPKPLDVVINYTGDLTAEVSWTSEAPSFDIDVNGTVTEGVTNPYMLTGLSLSTTYNVKVRANYGDGNYSDWTNAVSFKTNDCMNEDMCTITYEIEAKAYEGSYDYGWYYSGIIVMDANTGEEIDFWTVPMNESSAVGSINVCDGKELKFEWYCSYSENNDNLLVKSYSIIGPQGDVIASGEGPMSASVDYTMKCTLDDCDAPVGLDATPTYNGADVSWVGGADTYNIRYRRAGNDIVWDNFEQVGEDVTATGTLTEYTFDLSDYSGTGAIAIRHYNITDMYYLNIDDITLFNEDGDEIIVEGFENGKLPEGWINYDADGDGYVWGMRAIVTDNPTVNGSYGATSASYDNNSGSALTPDNWLIIPNVELGGYLTLQARGQDPTFAEEVFGVFVYEEEISEYEWTTVNNVSGNTYTITGLEPATDYEFQVMSAECVGAEWSRSGLFTTTTDNIFVTDGDWNDPDNWMKKEVPAEGSDVHITANAIIPANYVAYTAEVTIQEGGSITIKDGGELKTESDVEEVTMEKTIAGYGDGEGMFHLIASPAKGGSISTNVEGLLEGDYDYFRFVNSMNLEWRSYALTPFNMSPGNGFLYANKEDKTLKFTGAIWSSMNNYLHMNVTYNANYPMSMILAGNPFACTGTIYFVNSNYDFTGTIYKLNAAGDGFEAYQGYAPVAPGEAVLVEYSESGAIYFESEYYGDGDYLGEAEILLPQHGSTANVDAGPVVTLANDAIDNSEVIKTYDAKNVAVKLAGRTLYKDDKWNTLCLPFDVTLASSPLEGATAKTLESVDIDGENVKLTFGNAVSTLKAGTPYIIKWAESTEHIVEPMFTYVTINKSTYPYSEEDDDGNIFLEFKGYYDAFDVQANNKNIWYLTSGNKLKYTAENRTLKACRAYFWFNDEFFSNTARSFVLDFGDGNVSTSVDSLPAELTGEGEWFSVDGRKLGNAPTRKGVYLNNGKKIVVK